MGPLLFAIYINDLPEKVKSTCRMFAEDTKIIGTIRPNHIDTDRVIVQRYIDSISTWCKEWRMQLNAHKCKVMHIGKKVTSHPYSIQDSASRSQALEITTVEKDLGL